MKDTRWAILASRRLIVRDHFVALSPKLQPQAMFIVRSAPKAGLGLTECQGIKVGDMRHVWTVARGRACVKPGLLQYAARGAAISILDVSVIACFAALEDTITATIDKYIAEITA